MSCVVPRNGPPLGAALALVDAAALTALPLGAALAEAPAETDAEALAFDGEVEGAAATGAGGAPRSPQPMSSAKASHRPRSETTRFIVAGR
jgi:hypothetical protein